MSFALKVHGTEAVEANHSPEIRVRMSIPRQLVIKQDKACSTPVGTLLRGQARSSDLDPTHTHTHTHTA